MGSKRNTKLQIQITWKRQTHKRNWKQSFKKSITLGEEDLKTSASCWRSCQRRRPEGVVLEEKSSEKKTRRRRFGGEVVGEEDSKASFWRRSQIGEENSLVIGLRLKCGSIREDEGQVGQEKIKVGMERLFHPILDGIAIPPLE